MRKKAAAMVMGVVISLALLTGCGTGTQGGSQDNNAETGNAQAAVADEPVEDVNAQETVTTDETAEDANTQAAGTSEAEETQSEDDVTIRIGSLKGPTSMGLVYLMDQADKGEAAQQYEFTMTAAADELLPSMISGDLDIVLVPANVASVLYNKTEGGVSVIDINTLGVLYMVSGDNTIKGMEDLKGKTVYLTGKGTTPDYVLHYLLKENGLTESDVTLQYKSEATEVAAVLTENPEAIGVLPQPFVTAACAQNENLAVVMDLTEQWDVVQEKNGSGQDGTKSQLVTGVTVVRNTFLEEHKTAVDKFLEEHAASAAYANEHVEEAAELVAAAGIIEKAPVAVKAMPKCNITYIDGGDMMNALEGYLSVLCEQDAASVGGGLPGEDFYYINE
ncbi:MAG: ABC transporter substrate-binding protein [Lachnospiraceae bacterium]|nr:ABC transporter substrate-binding protein [Lachnospiraceae bacterium]